VRASAEAAVATGGRHGASAGGDFENFRPLREGHALRALEVTAHLFFVERLSCRCGRGTHCAHENNTGAVVENC
jgi:hypothetical protein